MQQKQNAPLLRKSKDEKKATAALLVATTVWGMGFVFQKIALEAGLTPSVINIGRFISATLVLGLVFGKTIRATCRKGYWKSGFLIGTVLFFASHLQTVGMMTTTPSNSAFITAMYVVFVPLVSWLFTRVRPSGVMVVACMFSFAGVAILSVNFSQGFAVSFGDGLTLVAAVLFALQIVLISHYGKEVHYITLAFMQMAAATFWSLIFFLLDGGQWQLYQNPKAILAVLYLGIFSTGLCFLLQTFGQNHLPSAKVGILLSTESLFGTVFSILLGYDDFGLRLLIGGSIIFVAMILPEVWLLIKLKRSQLAQQQRAGNQEE